MTTPTRPWKPLLMALAFVCFGFALGIFSDRLYLHFQAKSSIQRKVPTIGNMVNFFGQHLELSPKQNKQVQLLLKKFLRKGLKFFNNRPPEVRKFLQEGGKIRREFREAVRTMLNPKQTKAFNKMIHEADMRRFGFHFRRLRFQKQIRGSK